MTDRVKRVVVTVDLESEATPPCAKTQPPAQPTSRSQGASTAALAELYRVLAADLALWREHNPGTEPTNGSKGMPVVRRLHEVAITFMAENAQPPYASNPAATGAMNDILKDEFPTHPEWQLSDDQALGLMVLMRNHLFKPLAPYTPVMTRAW